MSIYRKDTVVADYPAYKVVRREQSTGIPRNGKRLNVSFTEITAADRLGLKKNGYYAEFRPGSVASYALEYNECPFEAAERARERGHKLHWISACASVLSSSKFPQVTLVEVEYGMLVRFEGLFATIEKDFNDNLRFAPVDIEELAASQQN